MSRFLIAALLAAWLAPARAQNLLWQVPAQGPSANWYYEMWPFADYNHDGYRDFLRTLNLGTFGYTTVQIASGFDGSTLWTMNAFNLGSPVAYAGDMDGDGNPDVALLFRQLPLRRIEIVSPSTGTIMWSVTGSNSAIFGDRMLGDIDTNGDHRPDFITLTSYPTNSDVFVYDNVGTLRYIVPCSSQGKAAVSLAKMGDMDGDNCDDFVVGCNDATGRGLQMLVSGLTGSIIRQTFGLLPGDLTSNHVNNLGDIDGDGVCDYVAYPHWSSQGLTPVAYSGSTGAVIRAWSDYGNSIVTGEDFDQDGVNDIVSGGDWGVLLPNVIGSTLCWSGRDGDLLWRVDNFLPPPGTGSNGSSGWMAYSASLGVQPGNPYPVVAWMDINWIMVGTSRGRTRAYSMARNGQGPVTGTACTSSGTPPLIGARITATGSRITIAKTHPGAVAALWMSFNALPQPVALTPLGFAGCNLYVAADAAWLRILGTTGIDRGYAAVDLPHTLASATTLGVAVHAQWIVLDPPTGAYAATQRHALRLQ